PVETTLLYLRSWENCPTCRRHRVRCFDGVGRGQGDTKVLRGTRAMSAIGTKWASLTAPHMSAFRGKADMTFRPVGSATSREACQTPILSLRPTPPPLWFVVALFPMVASQI